MRDYNSAPCSVTVGRFAPEHSRLASVGTEARGDASLSPQPDQVDIVAAGPVTRKVLEQATAAARSDAPVLIVGETGTGKELIARNIHGLGPRRNRAFVPVNCAALPHDLIESEMFGHRRGAFSGAHVDHSGLFVSAHEGTLFLDEIGELPPQGQAKLLRTLQDGAIRPVGGLSQRRVDVRVIAATNRSTRELRGGTMRADLFFRLSVLVMVLPPLRERTEEIPHLVNQFIARNRAVGTTNLQAIEEAAVALLARYAFPGNVRELEGMIESLCVTLPPAETTIRELHIRAWFRGHSVSVPLADRGCTGDTREAGPPLRLRELEAWAIRAALERSRGNKSRAAQLLGISRDRLYRKLTDIDRAVVAGRPGGR